MKKSLTGTICATIMVAIMLIVGIMVFGAIYDTMPTDVAQYTTAESFTTTTWGTPVQLDRTGIINGTETVYNATTTIIASGNYTLDGVNGRITPDNDSWLLNNTAYSIDYTWVGVSAMATDVMPVVGSAFTLASVIVIVMAAAAIILVLTKFGKGK